MPTKRAPSDLGAVTEDAVKLSLTICSQRWQRGGPSLRSGRDRAMSEGKHWVTITAALIGAGGAIIAALILIPPEQAEPTEQAEQAPIAVTSLDPAPVSPTATSRPNDNPTPGPSPIPEAAPTGPAVVEDRLVSQPLAPTLTHSDIENGLRGVDADVASACSESCDTTINSAALKIVIDGAGQVSDVDVQSLSGAAPRGERAAPRGRIGDAASCATCVSNVVKLRRFPRWMGPSLVINRTVQLHQ